MIRPALLLALLVLSRHRSQRSRAKSLRSVEESLLGAGGMLDEVFYYAIDHRRAQNPRSRHSAQPSAKLSPAGGCAQAERARGAVTAVLYVSPN